MEEYGLARPTVREALRLLESDQLISVRRGSHSGAQVRWPDSSLAAKQVSMLLQLKGATLADIYTARLIFEPAAVGMAAQRATPEDIVRLRRTLEEEFAVMSDAASFPMVAWRFHTEVVELSGNATLTIMASTLQHISQLHAERVLSGSGGDSLRRSQRAHQKLVSLLAAGDSAGAERFWRKHMEVAGEVLLGGTSGGRLIELLSEYSFA